MEGDNFAHFAIIHIFFMKKRKDANLQTQVTIQVGQEETLYNALIPRNKQRKRHTAIKNAILD